MADNPSGTACKPSAVVSPFVQSANGKGNGENIYANNPAASSPPSNPPQQSQDNGAGPAAPEQEPAALEEDTSADDDGPLYGNVGNVYAIFKATRPELDRVQKYLVDRLASAELHVEFEVSEHSDDSDN